MIGGPVKGPRGVGGRVDWRLLVVGVLSPSPSPSMAAASTSARTGSGCDAGRGEAAPGRVFFPRSRRRTTSVVPPPAAAAAAREKPESMPDAAASAVQGVEEHTHWQTTSVAFAATGCVMKEEVVVVTEASGAEGKTWPWK